MSSTGWNPTSMPKRETELTVLWPDYATHGGNGHHTNGNGNGSSQATDETDVRRVVGGKLKAERGE